MGVACLRKLVVDGALTTVWPHRYTLYGYQSEDELEREVLEHVADFFGFHTLYFDAKKGLRPGIRGVYRTIPDGLALDQEEGRLLFVEFELSSHDIYKHIVPQLIKFKRAFEADRERLFSLLKVAEGKKGQAISSEHVLTPVVKKNPEHQGGISSGIYSFEKALRDAVYRNPPRVLIVCDKATKEFEAVVKDLNLEVSIHEFRTYVGEKWRPTLSGGHPWIDYEGVKPLADGHIHVFEPYKELSVTYGRD
jgi:hypothetical protein